MEIFCFGAQIILYIWCLLSYKKLLCRKIKGNPKQIRYPESRNFSSRPSVGITKFRGIGFGIPLGTSSCIKASKRNAILRILCNHSHCINCAPPPPPPPPQLGVQRPVVSWLPSSTTASGETPILTTTTRITTATTTLITNTRHRRHPFTPPRTTSRRQRPCFIRRQRRRRQWGQQGRNAKFDKFEHLSK
jgi:hypothetical protein